MLLVNEKAWNSANLLSKKICFRRILRPFATVLDAYNFQRKVQDESCTIAL